MASARPHENGGYMSGGEAQRSSLTHAQGRAGRKRVGRLGLAVVLVLGVFGGAVSLALTSSPAFAAGTYTCTAPASGGTSTTFLEGVANTYSVSCYGTSGVSGTTAYPASITHTAGTLPADATEATSTTSTPACTTSTSGSGATEKYLLNCNIAETPTTGDAGTYSGNTFTANPGTDGGAAVTSGAWNLTVAPPTMTCTAPATGRHRDRRSTWA